MFNRRTMRRPSTGSFQIAVRTIRPPHSTSRGVATFNDNNVPAIIGSSRRQRFHVSPGGRLGLLRRGLVEAGVEVGGIPVPPVMGRRRLLVRVVVLGRLLEQGRERCNVHGVLRSSGGWSSAN